MEIKYLIKFTSEYKYARDLVDGSLFMNQAAFYHDIENGQGDVREATFSNTSMVYIGDNKPIYCLYMVYKHQIVDSKIAIENKIIYDFNAKYAVIVNYDTFIEKLRELKKEYLISFGSVNYKVLSIEDSKEFLIGKNNTLFFKKPFFSYQQEFRISIDENLEYILGKRKLNGKNIEVIEGYKPKVYHLKKNLNGIARIINVQDCKKTGGFTYIDLDLGAQV
ncbi:hypothetical protein ACKA04_06645 [Helcococcus kunzii]|uniref:hypothetical protein n=1 Tax=Helcococcus kunzii TaxID=40091 RepID=UPI0038ABA72E